MMDIVERVRVPAEVRWLWRTIGSFGGVAGWHPWLARAEAEGELPGALRRVEGKDGSTLVERLEEMNPSQHLYRYSTQATPLPVEHYTGELRAADEGQDASVVTWSVHFAVREGADVDATAAGIRGFLRAGLDHLHLMALHSRGTVKAATSDRPAVPTVVDYMTPAPYCAAPGDSLPSAHATMREHQIRHLPVVQGEKLVGILSDRDVNLVQNLAHARPEDITVEDAMTPDPYAVTPDVPLTKVARVLAERKIGSAVVVDGGRVAGVFTVSDALQALVEALDGTYTRRMYEGVTTAPFDAGRNPEPDLR